MKRLFLDETWPDSWKRSYAYDLQEVFGDRSNPGYTYAYKNRQEATLSLVKKFLPVGSQLLDIAGAQGNFSLLLAEKGYRVTWNDLREELIGYIKLKYEFGNLQFAPGNAFELEFPSLFDAILITEIIEHVAHPDEFLAKCSSLLKPGGKIVMTTPNGGYFRNALPSFSECEDPSVFESVQFKPNSDGHIFLLHCREIPPLAQKAGLEIDELDLFTNPFTSGHMKTQSLLRWTPRWLVKAIEECTQRMPQRIANRFLIHMSAVLSKPGTPSKSAVQQNAVEQNAVEQNHVLASAVESAR